MKYMGSKAAIATEIVGYINNYILSKGIDTYIEPFVGGANITEHVICNNKLAYDKNRYLIALFKHLQDGGELPDEVTREQYVDCRSHYKLDDGYYEDWFLGAVGFLAGFNGRFYDGCYANSGWEGEHFRDYYQESKRNILAQMKSLSEVKFEVSDYQDLEPHGALVYADPPYAGTKGYLTISKTFNHPKFWNTMREWSKDNIVLISEEQAPDDFEIIWEKEVIRSIKPTDKKLKTEKLFMHKSLITDDIGYDF